MHSKLNNSTISKIKVNKNDEFFISLGKTNFHSFIMLGVIHDDKPIFLCRVGKRLVHPSRTDVFKIIFNRTESQLFSESLYLNGEISYCAYAINYNRYLQFRDFLQLAQQVNNISCFIPVIENGTNVTMEKCFLPKNNNKIPSDKERETLQRTLVLSKDNTCRHTAVELTELVQGINHLTDNVSRNFLYKLPLADHFTKGTPANKFYVFPQPPQAYTDDRENDKNKQYILNRLFLRMEELIKKDPFTESTTQKFDLLKQLYNQQANIPAGNFDQALKAMKLWKCNIINQGVINKLRNQTLFGKLFVSQSTTETVTDELMAELIFAKRYLRLQNVGKSNPAVENFLITLKNLKEYNNLSLNELQKFNEYLKDTKNFIIDHKNIEVQNKCFDNFAHAMSTYRPWGVIIGFAMICLTAMHLLAVAFTVTVLKLGLGPSLLLIGGVVAAALSIGVATGAITFTATNDVDLADTKKAADSYVHRLSVFATEHLESPIAKAMQGIIHQGLEYVPNNMS